jgi:hypothetical protein
LKPETLKPETLSVPVLLLASVIAVLCVSVLMGWGSCAPSVEAAPVPTYTRPAPPPLTPAPGQRASPAGGLIELHVQSVQARHLWTVVQWQDGLGDWHDVEGWQGAPGEEGQVVWWVTGADLGKGPFRWVVYQLPGSRSPVASEPFYLPYRAGEVVHVEVAHGFASRTDYTDASHEYSSYGEK